MKAKIAIIAVASAYGEQGGAERFYQGVQKSLCEAGVDAEILPVVSDESNFDTIKESYLRFYDLDLSNYDGVISTKAPAYVVRHPNHICYLQHTMRVFYDMFELEFPNASMELQSQRSLIHQLDTAALNRKEVRAIFTISHEVKNRLLYFNNIDSEVLYQATTMRGFINRSYKYLFMPGRLHRWKRVDLIIQSMQHVTASVELLISGTGEDEESFKALSAADPRIRFLGRITDDELLAYYADALAVPFVPIKEDFGLVTLEAFHSNKPVITCQDSGEPARLVKHGQSGYVCKPDPMEIGQCIDYLANNPETAATMGRRGRDTAKNISWGNVAKRLLRALDL